METKTTRKKLIQSGDKQKADGKTLTGQCKTVKLINPGFETLSIEKLKAFPGYENLSEQQAFEALDSIQQLAVILYGALKFIPIKKSDSIDNQEVVYLNSTSANETPVIALHPSQKHNTA